MTDTFRRRLVSNICNTYPEANIQEVPHTPHSKVRIEGRTLLARHQRGKQTLVLGELKDSVRFSEEKNNSCPNYWHFSVYGFCPYNCHYCYLAGTMGVKFSPSVKVFVNIYEILDHIDRIANQIQRPTAFYLGKLQDGMALDPLTGFSRILVPFFAEHPYARLTLLTKSPSVENLLTLKHRGNTILSWTLNPSTIGEEFESQTPAVQERIEAMHQCIEAGYTVRAMIMPIIPVEQWRILYSDFLHELLVRIPVQRITLGGICSYRSARLLMNQKLPFANAISRNLVDSGNNQSDGRIRYSYDTRIQIYSYLIQTIRQVRPDLEITLCMEERSVIETVQLSSTIGHCICPL